MNLKDLQKIKEVMTPLPQTVDAEDFLSVAASRMELENIRHLPVLRKDGSLLGILSDRDIKLGKFAEEHFECPSLLTVGQVCTTDPYVVHPDESLAVVTLTMAEKRSGSVLIMQDDTVIGIFTATDACRWLGSHLQSKE